MKRIEINHICRKTYKTWKEIRHRCKSPRYKNYHGRGITVCSRWEAYSNFLQDMGIRPEGLSIDRMDNDGDYEPSNCKWSTPSEQAQNRRTSNKVSGVRYRKDREKWSAWGNWNKGKPTWLGSFFIEWDAICARKSWEVNIDTK